MIKVNIRDKNKKAEVYRREDKIPGVIYGPDIEPSPVYIKKDVFEKNLFYVHQRFEFVLEGEKLIGILQEIQKDPLSLKPIHFDIYVPSLKESVETTIPITFIGEEEITRKGWILNKSMAELPVEGLFLNLPEFVEIDVSQLQLGDSIYVEDIKLPPDVKITVDPQTPIATVVEGEIEETISESSSNE